MDVDVLDFDLHPCKTKLACVLVKYGELVLRCELVYHVGKQKPWVRMPEIWRTKTYKHKFAYWPSKELSDDFQKVVLKKIFDKYDLDESKVAQLHRDSANKRGQCKNV